MKIPINSVHGRSIKQGQAMINLKLEIKNLNQLNHIFDKVKKVKDVMETFRVKPYK